MKIRSHHVEKMLHAVTLFYILVVHIVKVDGCLQSIPTVTVVDNCPRNITEWIKSKSRKQCHWIPQNCTSPESFEYHCLSDKFLERFYEVCAPRKHIVGGHCPYYDNEKNSIELNLYQSCKGHATSCPDVFKSSMVYKYQECYRYSVKQNPDGMMNKGCICSMAESDFAKAFSILIFLLLLMVLLAFLYNMFIHVYRTKQKCRLDEPKDNSATTDVKNSEEHSPNIMHFQMNEAVPDTSVDSVTSISGILPVDVTIHHNNI